MRNFQIINKTSKLIKSLSNNYIDIVIFAKISTKLLINV